VRCGLDILVNERPVRRKHCAGHFVQRLTQDAIPVPTEPARIETPDDLARYTPPDPADSPVLDKLRRLKARCPNGEKAIVLAAESGWAPAVYLRGG